MNTKRQSLQDKIDTRKKIKSPQEKTEAEERTITDTSKCRQKRSLQDKHKEKEDKIPERKISNTVTSKQTQEE